MRLSQLILEFKIQSRLRDFIKCLLLIGLPFNVFMGWQQASAQEQTRKPNKHYHSNGAAVGQAKNRAKPNIVFILSDDQSVNSLASLGNTQIISPNINALAKQGVTFSHAYNMGGWNGAVCLASRAMFNTGRSLWQAKALEKPQNKATRIKTTWANQMKARGYQTYMTGKWHVHIKAEAVFDHVKHVRAGMPQDAWDFPTMVNHFSDLAKGKYDSYADFMPVGYNRPLSANDDSWSPTDIRFGGYYEGGTHWSEVVRDDAIEFIKQASQKETPFFMYIAFNAPHDPRQAPQAYQDWYAVEQIKVPESFLPKYPYQEQIGNGPSLRDSALAPFPRTEFAVQTHIKEYYASISHMDKQIGDILAALNAAKVMDNTYLIFTSDHGLAVGEHGLFGKQNLYEHSVRAPFIITGPDLDQGVVNDSDIYIQDAMATALDLAGGKKPEHVFFNSVLPLARGQQTESNYPQIYGGYIDLQRMIKQDGYKLIVYPKAQVVRLYHLASDPQELKDLAQQPDYQQKTKDLFKSLMALQAELKDPLDLSNIYQAL
ncbi:sulfatase-like hydrolase/transferase [Catenovulum adriaticum]|uniref:Sulfatase-like hydrolase/transferase n=1 Tax=Catenovulum adriaticum TaxID=2984846 RepID=A0ABY7ASK1_9ALTE|nr:sulfatase-like hydrolase/transferase [Catenovulum sp. TS8]WAJ72096.1 sulfatase-like hydrolase/transferase [Catenovulum sp. TS8]